MDDVLNNGQSGAEAPGAGALAAAGDKRTADEKIRELLYGKGAPAPESGPEPATEPAAEPKPEPEPKPDPEPAAEPAPAEIDYDQLIPLSTGAKVKLGALKDAYQEQVETRAGFANERVEIATQRLQVGELLSHVATLPPEVLAAARRDAQQDFARNRQQLEMVLPATRTKVGSAEVQDRLVKGLERFGVSAQEIAAIGDYRIVWVLNSLLEQSESIAQARERLKPKAPPVPRPRAGAVDSGDIPSKVNRAMQTRSRSDADAAIAALLSNR